jgi:hypothetical protein
MQKFVKYAAVALFTVSTATAAHAGGFGWGGHRSSGGLINLSPSIDLGGLNAPILNGNKTSLLSGILNGNVIGNGGILNNLLGGNRYSVRNSRGGRHHQGRW